MGLSHFQLLECEYFSLLLYDSKLKVFELWTKQDIRGRNLGLWETLLNIFHIFLTFYRPNNLIDRLVDNENNCCSLVQTSGGKPESRRAEVLVVD